MKAVVFGGSGFIGSYVVDALLADEFDTYVFDQEVNIMLICTFHQSFSWSSGGILQCVYRGVQVAS